MKKKKVRKNVKRTVLVTGSSGGIGRKIAIRFAKEGWSLLCHYNSSRLKAEELKKSIEKLGADCCLIKADFSSKKEINAFIKKIKGVKLDSLVNNAGAYLANKDFSKLTIEDITATFTVNVFVPMLLAANVFGRMKENGFGRIVNISSIAAKYGGSSQSLDYGCSKLALEGVTKTLARAGAEFNVLVNTIRPGVIDTGFHKKFPKDMIKRIQMIPLKRMGTPQDLQEIIYFLGSDKNNFITNETIAVSGGE